ncbi:phosphodiester glycosidase family protein [Paenibacillus thalictri]|uniref:Phosphodiester glycosidase family protein n=1 Tax=Paenibacillus thalictri TaxID=2527873 RepID=A0A4Q9DEM0_9BACL|nr:phosphodiester glycosidase family protein [Paenibacillus thalictri]TBL70069.1 phosphodiester glycosidase family protein [Paenibacillus thalictri]
MNPVQQINRVFLMACAPFLGALIYMLAIHMSVQLPAIKLQPAPAFSLKNDAENVNKKLDTAYTNATQIKTTIEKFFQLYEKSTADTAAMAKTAASAASRPNAIYDSRITAKLGKPSKQTSTSNIDLKLFYLNEANYKGYALKVDMKSDKAMKMVLGKDKLGSSETTLEAVRRTGAVAGVNAGGFADDNKTGKRYPLSTTMVGGKYVYGFEPTFDNLTFIGLSKDRKLIGGKFSRQADLDKLGPDFGATFVPTLLQNGKRTAIPSPWATSPARAPRTVVGNYRNDQLLFIVTDGYDERGNSGATLAELQDKLIQLGVVDAYNLDGGGSSSMIYDGQVINRPSDGKLRPLATNFVFFK